MTKPARGELLVTVSILGEQWLVYLASEKEVDDLVGHEGLVLFPEGRIYLNADLAPLRRPWVLAHEIAHVVALHTGASHALHEKFGETIAAALEEDWIMHVMPAFCATLLGMGWLQPVEILTDKEAAKAAKATK